MIKYSYKIGVTFVFFFLLISLNNIQAVEILKKDMPSSSIFEGNTLYVGGLGPNNYTKIQDAIDNASDGDTIFVYDDSSPYCENLVINKQISLIGEDKNTTIIDGNGIGDVILVSRDMVAISGFSVRNNGDIPMVDALIKVFSDKNTIVGNIISHSANYTIGIYLNKSSHNYIGNNCIFENGNEGIFVEDSTNNTIEKNEIFNNVHCAIVLSNSSNNVIINNDMYENHATISLWPGSSYNEIAWNAMYDHEWDGMGIWEESNFNYIHDNQFYDNVLWGIKITSAKGNMFYYNSISGSDVGIFLKNSHFTKIKYNNFIDCDCYASFENSSFNRWINNYWDGHLRFLPKRIDGVVCLPWDTSIIFKWMNFDWRPAKEPYDIGV
jgi:parallel beta-helix repeat protein